MLAVALTYPGLLSQGITPVKVLLRIYSDTHRTVDRSKEIAIFEHFSKTDLGVKMYYSCPKYRIEEFFEGRKLLLSELHDQVIMKEIAYLFCNYHHDRGMFSVIGKFDSKTPFSNRMIDEWIPLLRQEFDTYAPHLKYQENLDILKKLRYMTSPEFEKECRAMVEQLSKTEVVVSHCDIHELNIMRSLVDKSRLILIDFEYSTYNYRSFDLGMMYLETTIDYSYPKFPFVSYDESLRWTKEELEFFIRCYLERDAELKGQEDIQEYINKEFPKLMNEVKQGEALSNAMWAIWALLVTDWKIFDETKGWNLHFAKIRFEMYEAVRDQILEIGRASCRERVSSPV